MTTPLFLLRSVELGISIRDLDLLTIGLVLDMWTEKSNDGVKYGLPRRRILISFKKDYRLVGNANNRIMHCGVPFPIHIIDLILP